MSRYAVWSILVDYEAVCCIGFQTMANTSFVKELQALFNVGGYGAERGDTTEQHFGRPFVYFT
jgi:hypothetical protein